MSQEVPALAFGLLADHPDAVPTIARWYMDQWGHLRPGGTLTTAEADVRNYLNRDRLPLAVLALAGGEAVGVAQLKLREMSIFPEREHWLGGVYVAAARRGHGVAAGLIRHLLPLAWALGIRTLYLQTERLDGGLYRRLGWQPVEQVHHNGLDVLVMARSLDEPV